MQTWEAVAQRTACLLVLCVACTTPEAKRGPSASNNGGSGALGAAAVGGGAAGQAGSAGTYVMRDAMTVDAAPPCRGLRCQQVVCEDGKHTTLSGVAYAPNGTLPLYNVIAYVPNDELQPFEEGVTCNQCGALASGSPIVTALSDDQGRFQLVDVPVGENIPLVLQVGKWRRRVVIPQVQACVDNPISDPELTRLPRNRTEGDLPRIALTLGGCDSVGCMLPKVGIDPAEFGRVGEGKAVTVYGQGELIMGNTEAHSLWSDATALRQYDLTIFSCECSEAAENKDAASYQAVRDYLDAGGRVFTTDFQYVWYKYSPDPKLQATAQYPGGAPGGGSPLTIDTSFPKGLALANWLHYVEPTSTYGQVVTDAVFANLGAVMPADVQAWAHSPAFGNAFPWPPAPPPTGDPEPRIITINTPVGQPAHAQCGKAVHLDVHVNNMEMIAADFPAGCSAPMSQGEKAFAYFFFDLASCIQEEDEPPEPPPPVLE